MMSKIADHRQQSGALDLAQAVVGAGRDQVRPDQPVGGRTADEERARQQPEVAHVHGLAQRGERVSHGILVGGGGSTNSPPYGASPMSDGYERRKKSAIGAITTTAIDRDRARRPSASRRLETMTASTGKNTSWPLALDALRSPVTRPRRCSNQRLATIAASGIAMAPVLDPITRPHSR